MAESVHPAAEPWSGSVPLDSERSEPEPSIDSELERLRSSEARYRALVEASAAMVWTADAEGGAVGYSPSWRAFTGQARESMASWGWLDAVHPSEREALRRCWADAVASGELLDTEMRLCHAESGGWRLMRMRATPLREEDGRITSWACMNVDINQRRRAELALAESEARKSFLLALGDRLRDLGDASQAKRIAARMVGRQLDAARTFYGEMADDGDSLRVDADWSDELPSLVGEVRLIDTLGPTLTAQILAGHAIRVEDCATDERTSDQVGTCASASNPVRALLAVPLIRNGRFIAALCLQDTQPRAWSDAALQMAQAVAERTWEAVERSRAQAALRASEERLQAITDAMPALISYVDAAQRFQFVNQPYCEWFGRPLDQIRGRHLRDVLGADMYEVRRPYVERALAGESVSYEAMFPGEINRTTIIQHVPHRAEDGRVLGIYSLVQDVSDAKRAEAELRESRDEFAAVLDAVPAAILIATEPGCRSIRANRRAAELMRIDPGANLSKSDSSSPLAHFRVLDMEGREVPPEALPVQRAARGEPSFMHEERVVFDDGTFLDLLGNAVPLHGCKGEIRGAVGAFIDIGERKRAEDALREEQSTLETLNRTGAALAAELDLEKLVQLITDAGVAVTGARFGAFFHHLPETDGETMQLYTLSGADRSAFERFGLPRATAVFAPTMQGRSTVRSDDILGDPRYGQNAPHRGMPPGHLPVRSYLAVPVMSRTGEAIGSLLFGHPEPGRFSDRHERLMTGIAAQAAIAIDNARLFRDAQREIEQRTRAENHQRLLIGELNHRVKNSLAIVQSLAHQTFRPGAGMDEARRAFEGRLAALATAHNVLTRRSWEHATFAEIVEEALVLFHRPGAGRLEVTGEDMLLEPKTAVSLAMAFHELATNAVKYGAWSNETGRVIVEWQVNKGEGESRLQLLWREAGGPPVEQPSRQGFGSRMVERALAAELNGSVQLVYEASGLCCHIDAPLPAPLAAVPIIDFADRKAEA